MGGLLCVFLFWSFGVDLKVKERGALRLEAKEAWGDILLLEAAVTRTCLVVVDRCTSVSILSFCRCFYLGFLSIYLYLYLYLCI
jgi:hypothetical protein